MGDLVAQLTGVHNFELGAALTLYADPAQAYVFDADGDLLPAPRRTARKPDMARIDLDLAHAYRPTRAATRTTRCCR